jgi:hypothetical protein
MNIIKNIIIVLVIFGAGVVPCAMLAPIWGMGLIFIMGIFSSFTAAVLFLLAFSGLAGLCFFISAIIHYISEEPWKHFHYIIGIYGLIGDMVMIYFVVIRSNHGNSGDKDLLLLLPVFALIFAYLTRHKNQELVKT